MWSQLFNSSIMLNVASAPTEIIRVLEMTPVGRSCYLLQRQMNGRIRSHDFLSALLGLYTSRRVTCEYTFWRLAEKYNAVGIIPLVDICGPLLSATDTPPIMGNPRFVGPVWEPAFAQALWNAGLKIVQQYPADRYLLDIALISLEPFFKVDIEVDGRSTHCDRHGRRKVSDIIRDAKLKESGWIVKRFWVRELIDDMDACVKQVEQLWQQLMLKQGESK